MLRTYRTRRGAALAAALLLLVAALAVGTATAGRHDDGGTPLADPFPLQPPPVTVLQHSNQDEPGYVFVSPKANIAAAGQQGPEVDRRPGPARLVPRAPRRRPGLGLPHAALPRQARAHVVAGREPHRRRSRRGRRLHRGRPLPGDRHLEGRPRARRRRPRARAHAAGHRADHRLSPCAVRPLVRRRPGERVGLRRRRRGDRRRERQGALRVAQPRPRAAVREPSRRCRPRLPRRTTTSTSMPSTWTSTATC